ncbi:MAG TPA: alpha/beta hydrolase [Polyangiaceae bacterium]|nr:alpha/beta hydrolase [Polyangiaceae bacterium]
MANDERLNLHVEAQGSGPLLVLLHGFAGSARNFRPQRRAFSNDYRVVAFDARGHARSPAPLASAAYDPARFVADLRSVIDNEGGRSSENPSTVDASKSTPSTASAHMPVVPVVACGLSMGAGIALRYGIGHSEDICALVLASFPRTTAEPATREWAMGFAEMIEQFGLDAAGQRYVWGERSRFDPAGAALIRQGFLEHEPQALAHILRNVLAVQPSVSEMREALEHLTVPTLLVAGERDRTALESSEELSSHLPRAELEVIPDAGHIVNLEAAEQFNSRVRRFLSEHVPGEVA